MEDKKAIHNYALALYEISQNPLIITQLRIIGQMFDKYHSIASLVGKPTIEEEERKEWVKAHLSDFLPEIRDFIDLLDSRGRLSLVAKIVKEYEQFVYERHNIERIFITTATPVEESYLNRIARVFEKKMNRVLVIEHRVDPRIIGGVTVKIGSQLYDDSIRTKLNKITKEMKKEV